MSFSLTSRPTTSMSTHFAALEEALIAFPGCAVVISHDRWFLDRICTHILAFESDSQIHGFAPGKVRFLEGSWSDYEAFMTDRYGADALQPHRPSKVRFGG